MDACSELGVMMEELERAALRVDSLRETTVARCSAALFSDALATSPGVKWLFETARLPREKVIGMIYEYPPIKRPEWDPTSQQKGVAVNLAFRIPNDIPAQVLLYSDIYEKWRVCLEGADREGVRGFADSEGAIEWIGAHSAVSHVIRRIMCAIIRLGMDAEYKLHLSADADIGFYILQLEFPEDMNESLRTLSPQEILDMAGRFLECHVL